MNENWITNKLKGSYKIVFQQIDEMIKLPRIERQDDEKKSSMQTEGTRNNSRNVYRLTVNVISFAFLPFSSAWARFLTILSNSVVRNSHRQTDRKKFILFLEGEKVFYCFYSSLGRGDTALGEKALRALPSNKNIPYWIVIIT